MDLLLVLALMILIVLIFPTYGLLKVLCIAAAVVLTLLLLRRLR